VTPQNRYIPGVPCWVETIQPDAEAAASFYGSLFGWELEDAVPAETPGHYVFARLHGEDVAAIGSSPQGASDQRAGWNTYVWVRSADETAARVRSAGGRVLRDPEDVGEAGRTAAFADPEGAEFFAWEPRRHRGAGVVNAHGAVNFNDLHTRDPEAAAAFYGAVFGWERVSVGSGEIWALAGYGEFLDRRTPGTLASMAEMNAPERFEDAVASLAPIPDDESDTPAHWSVTFGADDADAIAAMAAELGGQVVAGPFDAPWVRIAVISDPQGATFTASQFVPPEPAGAAGA